MPPDPTPPAPPVEDGVDVEVPPAPPVAETNAAGDKAIATARAVPDEGVYVGAV